MQKLKQLNQYQIEGLHTLDHTQTDIAPVIGEHRSTGICRFKSKTSVLRIILT